jgi:hypothetical protein
MARIIRLTEQDLNRIVRRVIMEQFSKNAVLDFATVAGYKSGLFTKLQYDTDGKSWISVQFDGTKQLARAFGMENFLSGSNNRMSGNDDPTTLNDSTSFHISQVPPPKTRDEAVKAVKAVVQNGKPNPFVIKAGGTYKNKEGKTVSWGRPGATAGSEMVDAICKLFKVV